MEGAERQEKCNHHGVIYQEMDKKEAKEELGVVGREEEEKSEIEE